MEYINFGEIIFNYCHLLWCRFWNLCSIVFWLIWKANFHKKERDFPNYFRTSLMCCSINDFFHSLQIYVWNWDRNRLSIIQKIYFRDYSELKSAYPSHKAPYLFCHWLLVCLCCRMVFAWTSQVAILAVDNMCSGNIRTIRDKSERKIEFEVFMV